MSNANQHSGSSKDSVKQYRGESEANEKTEAELQSADGQAGQSAKSSENAKSHTKAGQHTGAGGGKKQERHH